MNFMFLVLSKFASSYATGRISGEFVKLLKIHTAKNLWKSENDLLKDKYKAHKMFITFMCRLIVIVRKQGLH